jgi:predicted nucleotidyltransferase
MNKQTVKDILKKNREIFKKYKVKSVALFGSYVRNEQKDNSDIDLLVEFNENTYDNFINLIFSLEGLLQKEVCVVTPDSISPYIKAQVLREAEKIEG